MADTIVTNYMLPTGGLLIAVFSGWVLSQTVRREEFMSGAVSEQLYTGWVFLIRYVSPVAVAIILLQSLNLF
jgi:NSS family neurotransmitter:Na+ symporter